VWVAKAGRGWGKTFAGAHWVRENVEAGTARHIALVGATASDVRDVMVEGPSGILATASDWRRPVYEPSKRRISWPNGASATMFSSEEPDRLRGPNHDLAWCDELASWSNQEAVWANVDADFADWRAAEGFCQHDAEAFEVAERTACAARCCRDWR
jgi:phage terminase large subunit-like protein